MNAVEIALARMDGARAAVLWAVGHGDWDAWISSLAALAEARLAAGLPVPSADDLSDDDEDEDDEEDLLAHDLRSNP